jgi:hypothetical protein
LAGRSASAAKEIKTLIVDSVGKVEEGSKLVGVSGTALEEISIAVKRVAEVVAQIATASQEQASGIAQVNKAVMQMDETTQQNAALVEEAAAASESIVGQASQLAAMVGRYHVAGEKPARLAPIAESGSAPAEPARASAAGSPATFGKERRGSKRPWAQPKQTASNAAKSGGRDAAGGGEDWMEF